MIHLEKPPRIIFQPTYDNSEKLKAIAEKNGISVSTTLNLILNSISEESVLAIINPDDSEKQ